MRGRPCIQWIIFAVLWLLLLYPLVRVTVVSGVSRAPAETDSESIRTWVGLHFSTKPDRFELLQADESSLWVENNPDALEFEQVLPVIYEDSGVELILKASLPESVTAVEITLTPDGRPECSQTVWVNGDADEAIVFSWVGHESEFTGNFHE